MQSTYLFRFFTIFGLICAVTALLIDGYLNPSIPDGTILSIIFFLVPFVIIFMYQKYFSAKLFLVGALVYLLASAIGGVLYGISRIFFILAEDLISGVFSKQLWSAFGTCLVIPFMEEFCRGKTIKLLIRKNNKTDISRPLSIGFGWGLCELLLRTVPFFMVYIGFNLNKSGYITNFASYDYFLLDLARCMTVLMHVINTFLFYYLYKDNNRKLLFLPFVLHIFYNSMTVYFDINFPVGVSLLFTVLFVVIAISSLIIYRKRCTVKAQLSV
ncbi:hypothetical protein [Xenorhabdus bovienii]|uniref:hypothetical protein n=1 Tax=Xenorhabdus bovienii TaxID=40576 RepID=UPI00237D09C5|nr:hypothetical protein [Xenorhabdus bovienii]MDE1475886.1 hypothetical protein [Xenorhabdus bovienii]